VALRDIIFRTKLIAVQVVPKDYKTMQALERAFENNILLRSCDEDQRSHIFGAMAEQLFQRGDVIIKQGDPGNYFYVIGWSKSLKINKKTIIWLKNR